MNQKLQLVSIGISLMIVTILVYNAFLIPPSLFIEISTTHAMYGKAEVETDYSKIRILSYPTEKRDPITFQVKLVNDGGQNIKDLFVEMDFQPRNPNWFDPSTVPIQTENYLPCSLALANACHIGIIPKGESVILEFTGAIDPTVYGDAINKNPRLVFSYWYDGSKKFEKTVLIELAGYGR